METRVRSTPSQMALELAELSRLDLVSNFKDWRRAVIEAVRARPNAPVELPEDWAFEVQIALNCLLIACVGESHGRKAMLLARHAFEQVLLEQVSTTGASFALLERLELLQSVRFATLFALADQESADRDRTAQCRRLAADILGQKAASVQGEPLAGNLAEFRAAMATRVASYALAELSAARA